jgi:hypothetical protein
MACQYFSVASRGDWLPSQVAAAALALDPLEHTLASGLHQPLAHDGLQCGGEEGDQQEGTEVHGASYDVLAALGLIGPRAVGV